jgi:hypothetical protein
MKLRTFYTHYDEHGIYFSFGESEHTEDTIFTRYWLDEPYAQGVLAQVERYDNLDVYGDVVAVEVGFTGILTHKLGQPVPHREVRKQMVMRIERVHQMTHALYEYFGYLANAEEGKAQQANWTGDGF